MDTNEGSSVRGQEAQQPEHDRSLTIFISYRKEDSGGSAGRLYDKLASRFGADNIFFAQETLEEGVKWPAEIRERAATCDAFIAVVGRQWASTLAERARQPEEDHVRAEIEAAFGQDSKVQEVFPVLVDEAAVPSEIDLRSFGSVRNLLGRNWSDLRHWNSAVQSLIEKLEQIGERKERVLPPRPEPSSPPPPQPPSSPDAVPPPSRSHYEEVAALMLNEESIVVPFLGPGVNSSDRAEPLQNFDPGYSPDSEELAAYLRLKLDPNSEAADLTRVSQNISVAVGQPMLHRELKRAMPSGHPSGSVHRFLAGFPRAVKQLGYPERYQLIVTSNYDDSLEQAFDDIGEPYDLAVYIASGRDRGNFIHIPDGGDPVVIQDAVTCHEFPIHDSGVLTRTVIMKIHGAVESLRWPGAWRDNFVITEDDYIDYMSVKGINSIVPVQLLEKLLYSHLLFLGHTVRDWNLRVFLMRLFREHEASASWAIQRNATVLDEDFWDKSKAKLAAIPLDEYVKELGNYLTLAAGVSGAQA